MDTTPEKSKRKSVKHITASGEWKERFRQGCLRRLKDTRYELLKNIRQTGSDNDESSQSSQEIISELMVDEWGKMKLESPLLSTLPNSQCSDGFNTFEFDDDGFEDIEKIMSVFEDIQQELLREEERLTKEYEDVVDFEEKCLCETLELLFTDSVTCPLCKKDNLYQNQKVISCSCGLKIKALNADLRYVHNQLNSAVTSHSSICQSEPQFSMLDLSGCNVDNMVMSCLDCDYMAIII